MSDSDWWSRKLGNQPPAPAPRAPTNYPGYVPPQPVQQPQPLYYPQQPVYQQPQQPLVVPGRQEPLHPGEQQQVLDPTRPPDAPVPLSEALQYYRGGEAHKKEGGISCPNCGSPNYTMRSNASGVPTALINVNNGQRVQPAPRCFECGYTGLYVQGDQSNWAR